jgi:hypothetical protein
VARELLVVKLLSHLTEGQRKTQMTNSAKAAFLLLLSTAMGFAETPQQLGAWSVYSATSNLKGNSVVMLQTTSQEQYTDGQGNPVQAKLDVICKSGKVSAIALEPVVAIRSNAMSLSGPVPTTRVGFVADGQKDRSESWAVLDGGRTLSPSSEVSQGKLMQRWIERISGSKKMSFAVEAKAESYTQPTFETGDLSSALSSVGCRY